MKTTRRFFLRSSLVASATVGLASHVLGDGGPLVADSNSRPVLAKVGCGGKGRDNAALASSFGDFAVVCDVDRSHAEKYANDPKINGDGARKIDIEEDYRRVLDRDDIDAVICSTPDHWHTKIAIEALQAGKHVYGEKPMTLTIDEVKQLRRAVHAGDLVLQVGNQQRSCQWFREAVAIAQSGALGEDFTATCSVGTGPQGGPFETKPIPDGLNWDAWLGQAPMTPYIPERCHHSFRWWYEYSGGKMTDWGAHHIDIAVWAINGLEEGPVRIEGEGVLDDRPDCYNAPQTFRCAMEFANGRKIIVQDKPGNGITLEGKAGSIFVSRGELSGDVFDEIRADSDWHDRIRQAAEDLYSGPYGASDEEIAAGDYTRLSSGARWGDVKRSHMNNFFRCMAEGEQPISDVDTVGVATMCCHLSNIAIRLGRPLEWDPKAEEFIGDDEANGMLAREQRKGYEIAV